MTRLLIIAPAFNEGAGLTEFIDAALAFRRRTAASCDVRVLIVDDGSVDGTLDLLRASSARQAGVVGYLSFSANAGHQAALIAGLCHAGDWPDAIVTMDADLEHPFDVVPRLLDTWTRTGAIVVHAVRRPSRKLAWLKRVPSMLFYRITGTFTGLDLQPGQADFKLWDGRTVRGVADYLPHIGSLRVFAAWIPGRKATVDYEQVIRPGRRSRFTFRKNYELAAISIVRFSDLPLKAITVLGAVGLVFSFAYGAFVAMASSRGQTVPGYSSTVLIVMTMGCLQLISIGMLATYLRRLVFARDLPPFIVREARALEGPEAPAPSARG